MEAPGDARRAPAGSRIAVTRVTGEGARGIPEATAGENDSLEAFLDQLAEPAPAPSSGTAAAAAAAMAAALVVMVGRGSPDWAEGAQVAAQAQALRTRLTGLGEEDARAYAAVPPRPCATGARPAPTRVTSSWARR